MSVKILSGHTSIDTAYLVEDYPYGFHLRCKIRYWLEFKSGKGARLWSQTTNPTYTKGEAWNKPKASTYARFGACMYLDENNHVQWSGLSEYSTAQEAEEWRTTFGTGVPDAMKPVLDGWIILKRAYEKRRDEKSLEAIADSQTLTKGENQ